MHRCILVIAHVLLSLFYTYYVLYNCTPYMATAITANAATAVSSTILRYCFVFIALHTYGRMASITLTTPYAIGSFIYKKGKIKPSGKNLLISINNPDRSVTQKNDSTGAVLRYVNIFCILQLYH